MNEINEFDINKNNKSDAIMDEIINMKLDDVITELKDLGANPVPPKKQIGMILSNNCPTNNTIFSKASNLWTTLKNAFKFNVTHVATATASISMALIVSFHLGIRHQLSLQANSHDSEVQTTIALLNSENENKSETIHKLNLAKSELTIKNDFLEKRVGVLEDVLLSVSSEEHNYDHIKARSTLKNLAAIEAVDFIKARSTLKNLSAIAAANSIKPSPHDDKWIFKRADKLSEPYNYILVNCSPEVTKTKGIIGSKKQ